MANKRNRQRKPQQKTFQREEDSLVDLETVGGNEVDAFHEQRDSIAFNDEEHDTRHLSSEDDDDEEEVLALSDEDEENEVEEYLRRMPGVKKRLGALEDEERGEEENADASLDVMAWGSRKNIYYNDDAEYNDDYAEEEEAEARRLQKERIQSMNEDDFLDGFAEADDDDQDDSFQATLKKLDGGSAKLLKKNSAEDRQTVQEINEDLEKIDLEQDQSQHELLASLSKEQLLERVISESPELLDLLSEYKEKVDELKNHILPLLERVKNGELPMNQGVSLLSLKNQLLLNYCLNLVFYFYLKASGKKVKDHPVIEKLVELRLYLEKIKPLEQKLKYQIDKLVKAAVTGESSVHDPLKFKPNLSGFATAENEGEGNEEQDEEEDDGVYRAPKIAPVFFDEAPGAEDKRRKAAERARKQASSSRLMKDLMDEMSEMPEEVMDAGNMLAASVKKDKEWEQRVEAEEEMMTRLPITRKDKFKMRQQKKFANELANLDDFGDLSYLDNLAEEDEEAGDDYLKKKKKLREIVKSAARDNTSDSKKRKSGDDDIPYRERKQNRLDTTGEDYNRHLDDQDEELYDNDFTGRHEEDEYYESIKNQKQAAKSQKQADHDRQSQRYEGFDEEEGLGPDDKRAINYDILKNKGLTPARKREQRNPRLKHRKKYESSMKKLKSFKSVVKTQSKRYGGEETGIKKNLARSVRF